MAQSCKREDVDLRAALQNIPFKWRCERHLLEGRGIQSQTKERKMYTSITQKFATTRLGFSYHNRRNRKLQMLTPVEKPLSILSTEPFGAQESAKGPPIVSRHFASLAEHLCKFLPSSERSSPT